MKVLIQISYLQLTVHWGYSADQCPVKWRTMGTVLTSALFSSVQLGTKEVSGTVLSYSLVQHRSLEKKVGYRKVQLGTMEVKKVQSMWSRCQTMLVSFREHQWILNLAVFKDINKNIINLLVSFVTQYIFLAVNTV